MIKTVHIFKSALNYINYYKLVLSMIQKEIFKIARLLQDLIGDGIYPPKKIEIM